MSQQHNCTFFYFKKTGKWKYEGRGWFPSTFEITQEDIADINRGLLPGLSVSRTDMTIVVIPDEDCDSLYAYPRMILA